jgi:hypothetical protein
MNNKKQFPLSRRSILLICAVVVLAVALAVFFYARYETANHAQHMSNSDLLVYNSAMTARAHTSGWITQDMILVLHTLHKDRQADSEAEFYIYQLPDGADPEAFMNLHAGEIQDTDGLVLVGTVSCRIPEDSILSAYNFQTTFIR